MAPYDCPLPAVITWQYVVLALLMPLAVAGAAWLNTKQHHDVEREVRRRNPTTDRESRPR